MAEIEPGDDNAAAKPSGNRSIPRKALFGILGGLLAVLSVPPAIFALGAKDPNWGEFWLRAGQPYATLTAGVAALSAGALAYWNGDQSRRQTEYVERIKWSQADAHEAHRRESEKRSALHDRFTKAVEALANESIVIRLAGANIVASICDEWVAVGNSHESRVCLEVLIGYLRHPRSARTADPMENALLSAIVVIVSKRLVKGRWPGDDSAQLADLSSLDLSNLDLAGIRLDGCKLTGLNASGANLVRATFVGSELDDADFTAADMRWADLSRSTGNRAIFQSSTWLQTDFRQAKLDACVIRLVNGAPTRGDLKGEYLSSFNWETRASFKRARMVACEIDSSTLTGVDFTGAVMTAARISATVFSESIFKDTHLKFSHIRMCNFSGANMADLAEDKYGRFSAIRSDSLTYWPSGVAPEGVRIEDDLELPSHFEPLPAD